MDHYNLERFIEAQSGIYQYVKEELTAGDKQSHWMWFVFPQIKGLGFSSTANYYAIQSLAEAKAYFQHPVLGKRLEECCQILLKSTDKTAEEIFGFPDILKLKSSMTLFHIATGNPLFQQVLDKYYQGEKDEKTLKITIDRQT
ncbi:MAG: DUF1810 domain-containing protein [Tannerella sp.]|jgi:uncharacterized protein (DUF1810 family)|nr:DUF1810 domain-containing protein [Tannerella sp.]